MAIIVNAWDLQTIDYFPFCKQVRLYFKSGTGVYHDVEPSLWSSLLKSVDIKNDIHELVRPVYEYKWYPKIEPQDTPSNTHHIKLIEKYKKDIEALKSCIDVHRTSIEVLQSVISDLDGV